MDGTHSLLVVTLITYCQADCGHAGQKTHEQHVDTAAMNSPLPLLNHMDMSSVQQGAGLQSSVKCLFFFCLGVNHQRGSVDLKMSQDMASTLRKAENE